MRIFKRISGSASVHEDRTRSSSAARRRVRLAEIYGLLDPRRAAPCRANASWSTIDTVSTPDFDDELRLLARIEPAPLDRCQASPRGCDACPADGRRPLMIAASRDPAAGAMTAPAATPASITIAATLFPTVMLSMETYLKSSLCWTQPSLVGQRRCGIGVHDRLVRSGALDRTHSLRD